jgi:hypothetical protein
MAPTKLMTLRRKAKSAGVPASEIRKATTAADLESLISAANGKPRKASAKKAVKKAVKRMAVKKSATKAPAAKSTKGKAKRLSSTPKKNGASGRNLIDSVDYDKTNGWNPRVGSPPDRIMKALKKARGNREKAFQSLKADVWDFVGKVKRNGERRTKSEAEAMLKYRISRTLFDFTVQTKQHKKATNRIEYGTGPHAKQAPPKRGRPARKPAKAAVEAPKRRGRPPGSKNKATVKRGPGRPKGSKNKK